MMDRRLFLGGLAAFCPSALFAQGRNPFAAAWPDTDFSKSTIDLGDVISAGPPKDGIPALSNPAFLSGAMETTLTGREPVMTIAINGQTARGSLSRPHRHSC